MNSKKYKIKNADIFVFINIIFFLWMCYAVYYDRFIHYRGSAYLWEFFVYATLNVIVVIFLWIMFRNFNFPNWLIILVQLSIFMHFAGGLINIADKRLYDCLIFNIRYDKYVHFFNSFIGGVFLYKYYFRELKLNWLIKDFILIFTVLGIGALVEIVEYLVTLTVETNGVGNYDNNLQDLISNFIGITLFVVTTKLTSIIKYRKSK